MPPVKSLTVRANGLEHHVLEWLPTVVDEEARTCVLLHGYMDAAGTWDEVAPDLSRAGLRVLAPDMRGFGDGPRVSEGGYYHFADYVADLADLVDALTGGDPFLLAGHSMGGTIASLYAGAFPERVAKLALLEGLGPPDIPPDALPDRMRRWIEEVRGVRSRGREPKAIGRPEDARARLAASHPGVDPAVLATRVPHLVRDLGGGRVGWRYDPLHKTVSPVGFSVAAYTAFARRARCPVLYVDGGSTGFHPADEAARLAAFGRVEHVSLDGAGHMMHWTRPRELVQALLKFWLAPDASSQTTM
jgi:pimeloyl-ACP methyl ester carboxylesterase